MGLDDRIDRRTLIARAAAGGAAIALGSIAPAAGAARRIRPEALLPAGTFRHGVGAGAPGRTAITLWTRVSDTDRPGRVELEVARQADFRKVVDRRLVRVAAVRDNTARVNVGKLAPGEEYFYRFSTRAGSSAVGRFRTARPADSKEPLRIGFFSCQDYQAGYYTAHAGLAQEDLDLVVCLGDYIYEHTYFKGPAERTDTTGFEGGADAQTLAEYRRKYALYREDANLQAVHHSAAFAAVWDDHEVEDNWAGNLPGEKTPVKRVPFLQRRQNGMLAFFEWMPRFRMPSAPNQIYGSLPLGANVEMLLLDSRSYRDKQPCNDSLFLPPCLDGEANKGTFLGTDQKAWLKRALKGSPARWKVVANQDMIMGLDLLPLVPSAINPDAWDGYGVERRELLEYVRRNGIEDVTFMTGDIHTFFAGDVHTDGRITGRPVATEFVGGSITSKGLDQFVNPTDPLLPVVLASNPHLHYAELESHGYGILEARPDELLVTYRAPGSVATPTSPMRTLARFRVAAGKPQVNRV